MGWKLEMYWSRYWIRYVHMGRWKEEVSSWITNFWLYIKFKIPDIRSLIGKKSSSSPLPHFRNYTCHGYGGERIILYILLLANKPMFFPIIYGFFFWRVKFLFFVFILNPSIPRDDGFKPTQWHAFLGRECIWYC